MEEDHHSNSSMAVAINKATASSNNNMEVAGTASLWEAVMEAVMEAAMEEGEVMDSLLGNLAVWELEVRPLLVLVVVCLVECCLLMQWMEETVAETVAEITVEEVSTFPSCLPALRSTSLI